MRTIPTGGVAAGDGIFVYGEPHAIFVGRCQGTAVLHTTTVQGMRMRVMTIAVVLTGMLSVGAPAHAQAARIGRLPALAPLEKSRAHCKASPVTADLRSRGVATLQMLSDSAAGRLISVGADAAGRPKSLYVLISSHQGTRSESESVFVIFDVGGRIVSGSRSAMTGGVPARLSEDRRGGLFPTDTAAAVALAHSVQAYCR